MNTLTTTFKVTLTAMALALVIGPFTSKATAADEQLERGNRENRGQRQGMRQERREEMRIEIRQFLQGLDLTDEQKQEIGPVIKEAAQQRREWMQENREKVRELRQQIRENMKDGDKDAAKAAAQQIRDLLDQGPKVHEAIRPYLNAEQAAQLDAFVADKQAERMEGRQERRENWQEQRQGRGPGQGMGQGPEGGRHQTMLRVLRNLDLTDEQKQQIREIHENTREEMQAWRDTHAEQMKQLRDEMRTAIQDRDREAAETIREEMKTLMDTAPRPIDEIKAVLTAEQNARVEQMLEQARENRRENRGNRGPHGDRGDGRGRGEGRGKFGGRE